jgi:molybdenum cofactor synthesis domain-containing protein
VRAAVVTISTSVAAGRAEDRSGPRLSDLARRLGAEAVEAHVVADDREAIADRLRRCCDEAACDLVLTSGGTGLSPTDHTPEATRAVIEREAPGIPEAMRLASREHTPNWMLSRAVAGTRGHTLVVNLPGKPESIEQAGAALAPALEHALVLLAGGQPHPHASHRPR